MPLPPAVSPDPRHRRSTIDAAPRLFPRLSGAVHSRHRADGWPCCRTGVGPDRAVGFDCATRSARRPRSARSCSGLNRAPQHLRINSARQAGSCPFFSVSGSRVPRDGAKAHRRAPPAQVPIPVLPARPFEMVRLVAIPRGATASRNDVKRGAVLDRLAGILDLGFAEDLDSRLCREGGQADINRRVVAIAAQDSGMYDPACALGQVCGQLAFKG